MLGVRLQEYGLKDGSVVVFKDLGPQVRVITVVQHFHDLAVISMWLSALRRGLPSAAVCG